MDNSLIKRQNAIDEWKNDFKEYINALDMPKDDYKGIIEYIDELPSAQPEQCEDCVNFSNTRLLIQPAQPEMTTTAITQAKRFCRYQGIMCEYATDMGCCEITGCAKRRTG